jgi:hypothetical protein
MRRSFERCGAESSARRTPELGIYSLLMKSLFFIWLNDILTIFRKHRKITYTPTYIWRFNDKLRIT